MWLSHAFNVRKHSTQTGRHKIDSTCFSGCRFPLWQLRSATYNWRAACSTRGKHCMFVVYAYHIAHNFRSNETRTERAIKLCVYSRVSECIWVRACTATAWVSCAGPGRRCLRRLFDMCIVSGQLCIMAVHIGTRRTQTLCPSNRNGIFAPGAKDQTDRVWMQWVRSARGTRKHDAAERQQWRRLHLNGSKRNTNTQLDYGECLCACLTRKWCLWNW